MCGLCVEACPTRALTLTNYYELSFTSREDAIWTKEQLLEPPPALGTDPADREGVGAARQRRLLGVRADLDRARRSAMLVLRNAVHAALFLS